VYVDPGSVEATRIQNTVPAGTEAFTSTGAKLGVSEPAHRCRPNRRPSVVVVSTPPHQCLVGAPATVPPGTEGHASAHQGDRQAAGHHGAHFSAGHEDVLEKYSSEATKPAISISSRYPS
jgi:hypothetical protein